ncbi:unnamed protein product [Closterium sp. NIES-54]
MYITLYFIVSRLPDSLRAVRDHFLALDPTALTVHLLEQHLLAAETSVVAVGAARGTPRTPFFEGCSPSPLAPSYASAATIDVLGAEDVGATSASGKSCSNKGKGGRDGGGGSGGGGGGGTGDGGHGGSGGRSGGFGGGGGGSNGGGGSGNSGSGGGRAGATQKGGSGCGQRQQQQRPSKTPSPLQLHEAKRPHRAQLLRYGVAIFDLDYDAILPAMYALSVNAEGDCYLCVPPDPGIEAAALGAGELDSGASRYFFRDSTTLTPLSAPVPIRLADPSGGPIVARSSIVLPCPADAMVTTTTLGGRRVSICTCTRTGRHVATFTRWPGSSLYTLATEPPQVAASALVSASGQVAPPCSCRLLSHQTFLWHHRLGHPSLPRIRGMHSRLLISGLPRSLPPLPPSPAPPCLHCVEGRQRAPPHSLFPPTIAPLQTLHMDVWGPARVSGQGRERYFLLVVDNYTRYTTVFPLRSKGEVSNDLPVLRLHSDKGGEFSSNLLWDFCGGEGILQSFTLPASPQQNRIVECRIGLVLGVTRTSMIYTAAPHFLWPFGVRYAAHQLNLWPRVSLPETSPTLRWTGKVGDASVFQDVKFDESVPFYRLFPYRSSPPPPPPFFLAPGPPPVDPLPPQGPAPSGVSQVDPLPITVPVEVAVGSGAASGGAEPGGYESESARSGGAEPEGAGPGGAELECVGPLGSEPEVVEPGGAESEGAESGGAEPRGTASSGGPAGASPRLSPRLEPLSLLQLRDWFALHTRLRSGATGAGDSIAGDTRAGGVGVTRLRGAGVTAGAVGPGGARTRDPEEHGGPGAGGTRAGGAGARGAGAGDTGAVGARAGGAGTGGAGAGGAGAGDTGAVDPRAGGAGAGGAVSCGTGAGGTVWPRP